MNKELIKILLVFVLIGSTSSSFAWQNIFKGQTSINKPFDLRDPFQPPKFQSKKFKKQVSKVSGVLNNQLKLDEKVKIEDIQIVGVLVGEKRRVLLEVNGKGPFRLREGEKVGLDGPELKAILPGGIILVEKITNIYDEIEYIETVIPISK